MNKDTRSEAEILRQKAEDLLKNKESGPAAKLSAADTFKLIHELEVNRLELEMQGEELQLSKSATEEASRVSEERYCTLFENVQDVFYRCNLAGIIHDISPSIKHFSDFDRNELIGTNVFNLYFNPVDRDALLSALMKNGQVRDYEVKLKTKNGDIRFASLNASLMFDANGKPGYIDGSLRDNTERSKSEVALRESELRFRTLFDQANEGLILLTMDGRISEVNKSFAEMHGYTVDELRNTSINDLDVLNEDAFDGRAEVMRRINAGEVVRFEVEHYHKDGHTFILSDTASLITIGNQKFYLAFHQDITERKKAEEEIRLQKEELHFLNAEKDKFFSIIAHELRGPFNGFLGFTNMLVDELDTLTLKEIQKIAVSMRNSATNLFSLLENLLEWSRLQRGITTFVPTTFNLNHLVAETLRPVKDSANKKGITISIDIPIDLEVFADEYMLGSILRNLASNAVKFTVKGGSVTIAAIRMPGNSVEITVSDTGIGMNGEIVDSLFRPDLQTSRKGTDGEPSTGLGLIICKEFIEKHGGKLQVESEEGKGSVFSFTLPANSISAG
ncbi:MAG: PAS domain S-box protein [Bacteroidales bacterium]